MRLSNVGMSRRKGPSRPPFSSLNTQGQIRFPKFLDLEGLKSKLRCAGATPSLNRKIFS